MMTMFTMFVLLSTILGGYASISSMNIDGKFSIPHQSSLANIKVSLNGDQYVTQSRRDGSFVFHNIPSGIYLLDVLSVDLVFSQYKLKVNAETSTVNVVEYKYQGATRAQAPYPLLLSPHTKLNYFQKKEGFNLYRAVAGNPMMILMVVMGAVVVLFPKLLAGMDKEELEKIMEEQKKAGMDAQDPMKMLQQMMGGKKKDDSDDED